MNTYIHIYTAIVLFFLCNVIFVLCFCEPPSNTARIYIYKPIITSSKAQEPERRDLIAKDEKDGKFVGIRFLSYKYIYIYPCTMITSEALAKTIDNDPQFNVKILYLLSKATLPITVHELEYLRPSV